MLLSLTLEGIAEGLVEEYLLTNCIKGKKCISSVVMGEFVLKIVTYQKTAIPLLLI